MALDYTNVDVYGAFSRHLNMGKKQANTHGGEYWTYCPFCGAGDDRFHVWPYRSQEEGNNTHYWCRVCGRTGDAVDFVEQVEGLDFIAVCEALNIDLGTEIMSRPKRAYQPNDDEAPSGDWQVVAWAFAKQCRNILWSETGKNALTWLRARGLSDETIKRAALGYNPKTRFDEKDSWAVGYLTDVKKVWLPRGITIPWFIEQQIWKVSIRRPDPDIKHEIERGVAHPAKYVAVKGGSNGLYGIDQFVGEKPTVIVEGEFDKLIASQALVGDVNVVATGSTAKGRGEKWALTLAQSPICLIAYDSDEGGRQAIKEYWSKYLPHSLPWQPWAKDVNDMWVLGMNVREWLLLGFETAEATSAPEPKLLLSTPSVDVAQNDAVCASSVEEPFICSVAECQADLNDPEQDGNFDENGIAFCGRCWARKNALDLVLPVFGSMREVRIFRKGEYTLEQHVAYLEQRVRQEQGMKLLSPHRRREAEKQAS